MGLEAIRVRNDVVRVTEERTTRRTEITYDGKVQDVVDFARRLVSNVPIDLEIDFSRRTAVLKQEWDYKKIKPPVLRMPPKEGPYREGFKPLT